MLVLTRKLGEEIVIDGNVRIRVVRLAGNQVRLGIEAPLHIPVRRSEVVMREAHLEDDPVKSRLTCELH